jgi:hypothetical protein
MRLQTTLLVMHRVYCGSKLAEADGQPDELVARHAAVEKALARIEALLPRVRPLLLHRYSSTFNTPLLAKSSAPQ